MIRSLIIRQIFIVAEIALALFFLVTGAAIALLIVRDMPIPDQTAMANPLPETEPVQVFSLGEISDRELYNGIIRNGLFGAAGRWNPEEVPDEPEPPPPPEPTVEETSLQLRLMGTVALSEADPFGMAIIENMEENDNIRSYALGDSIVDDVTLAEVHKRRVILENNRVSPPKLERLSMDDSEDDTIQADLSERSGPEPVRANQRGSDRIELSRNELVTELYDSYDELVRLEPELVTDDNGEVIGVTASDFEEIPLAQQLGLVEGDVLQTVNNVKIDSQEKIMEIVQNQQNASAFRIGIQRGGETQVITYTLR